MKRLPSFGLDRAAFCGKGAYGVVHPGRSKHGEHGGEEIAMKCLKIPMQKDWCGSLQLAREMYALRTFSHCHVLALLAVAYQSLAPGSELGIITLRYEVTLAQLDRDATAMASVRRFVFSAIASALHYVHARGCVHCDVKPQNIFVSLAEDKCVLGDFGLMQPAHSIEQEPYVVTSWYRPPELVFSSHASYGPAVDIWSLGCILAEMISGRPLFATSHGTTIGMHISAAFGLPAITEYDGLCSIVQQYVLKNWMKEDFFTVDSPPTEQEWEWIEKTVVFDDAVRCPAQNLCDSLDPAPRSPARDTDLADLAVDPVAALQTEIYRVPRWVEEPTPI